ncbi:Serine/threonine-protein phosphatase [Trichostrongylus colubriformis]|uniref:Serine/threonine-protein phosphatase n=1 Tax=Trichostrongylus colubriformis TaxID=6319 RepID=A0AAN8ICH1_TRICO
MQSLRYKSLVPKTSMPTLVDRMIRRITREGHLSGFTDEQVLSVLRDAKSSLEPQPATLEIDAPIVIFGDIHGQLRDLLRFFTIVGPPPQNKILFLGDYVDRCKKSFEVIMLLLCYRIKFPHLIHLLRGNHECSKMNRLYGFYEELRRKRCIYMWKKFQEVFNEMPLCAVVSSRLLCMHGGISPEIQNWDSLVTLQKPKTPRACDDGIAVDLMWSDPSTDSCTGFQFNATRATSYIFGGDTIANICDMLDISMVVRAHEVVRGGHQFMYDRKLVTIFSAPNYCGTDGNAASVMKVSRRLEVSFVTLKPRLDTNRLSEEKRVLLEKLAADAMAKSPDPYSRIPKEKEPSPQMPKEKEKPSSSIDDCLIGPIATADPKGAADPKEMQQRRTDLLSLMDDSFETPRTSSAPPKTTAVTKAVPSPTEEVPPLKSPGVETKKRDTTPAPAPSLGAGASPTQLLTPVGKGAQQLQGPPSTHAPNDSNTAKLASPNLMMTSPQTQNSSRMVTPKTDMTAPSATSKPTSGASPQKRPTISLLYPYKSSTPNMQTDRTPATATPNEPDLSQGVIVTPPRTKQPPKIERNQPVVARQEPRVKEIVSTTSDPASPNGKALKSPLGVDKAPPPSNARSVEEAAKAAMAATKTPPQPDPKSQSEIIDATEKALKNNNPAEPKK